jgi:hypothetical protein
MPLHYANITYRQRQPHGVDLPLEQCETTKNGPFRSPEAAERYATMVANQTPVFQATIVEEGD